MASPLPVFDSHAHLITADTQAYPPSPMHGKMRAIDWTEPFDADRLIAEMDASGVTRACAVQRGHFYGYNNAYILDSARRFPDRMTPVLMVNGQDEGTLDYLRKVASEQPIGGIRLAAARIADLDTSWLNSPGTMKIWELAAELGTSVAVIVFARHLSFNLPALKMIADLFPSVNIVIDHAGLPHGSNYEVKWTQENGYPLPYLGAPDYGLIPELRNLRQCRNIFFKLTGINAERLRDEGISFAAFTRRFVNEFGADRVMWGSDVGQTKGAYGSFVADLRSMCEGLSGDEQAWLTHKTAEKVYGGSFAA